MASLWERSWDESGLPALAHARSGLEIRYDFAVTPATEPLMCHRVDIVRNALYGCITKRHLKHAGMGTSEAIDVWKTTLVRQGRKCIVGNAA